MKILFLSQWFQPEPMAKGVPFLKEMLRRGHNVEVLTGFPNYPGGKLYDGYRQSAVKEELVEGIRTIRTCLYPSHDRSALKRSLNYSSFSASSYVFGKGRVSRPDVVLVYNLVTLCPTWKAIKRRWNVPVVMDVQDLWPDSVLQSGMRLPTWMRAAFSSVATSAYRTVDYVACNSHGMRDELINRGVKPDVVSVIYNWAVPEYESFNENLTFNRSTLGFQDKIVVLFAGTMGLLQGMDTILDCASLCKTELPQVRFWLVGGGSERQHVADRIQEEGLSNVILQERVGRDEMPAVYGCSDILLIHLVDRPLMRITIPSKVQACLHAGKPILGALHGDAASLVSQAEAGVVCRPGCPESMLTALRSLTQIRGPRLLELGERGRTYYMQNLSQRQGLDKMEQLLLRAVKR